MNPTPRSHPGTPSHKHTRSLTLKVAAPAAAAAAAPAALAAGPQTSTNVPTAVPTAPNEMALTAFDITAIEELAFNIDDFLSYTAEAQASADSAAQRQQIRTEKLQSASRELLLFISKNVNTTDAARKVTVGLIEHVNNVVKKVLASPSKLATELRKYFDPTKIPFTTAVGLKIDAKPLPNNNSQVIVLTISVEDRLLQLWNCFIQLATGTFNPIGPVYGVDKCVFAQGFVKLFAPCMTLYSVPRTVSILGTFEASVVEAAIPLNAVPMFMPSRVEDFLILIAGNPQELVKVPIPIVDLENKPKVQLFPILPAPLDRHAYFLFANTHFPGQSIENLPARQLVGRYTHCIRRYDMPEPIHAEAIGHSVIRMHFASVEAKEKIVNSGDPKAKKGIYIMPGTGPVVVLSQVVRALAILAPIMRVCVCLARDDSTNHKRTFRAGSPKHRRTSRCRRRSRCERSNALPLRRAASALAALTRWTRKQHALPIPVCLSRVTQYLYFLYKLSFLLSFGVCLAVSEQPQREFRRQRTSPHTGILKLDIFLIVSLYFAHVILDGTSLTRSVLTTFAALSRAGIASVVLSQRPSGLTLCILLISFIPGVHAMEAAAETTQSVALLPLWTMLALNVTSGFRKKTSLLVDYIQKVRADVVVISETGLTRETVRDKKYYSEFARDYNIVHLAPVEKKRENATDERQRKGVSVMYHQRFNRFVPDKEIEHNAALNLIRIPFVVGGRYTHVIGAYAEPGSKSARESYWKEFEKWIRKLESERARIIVLGDLNAPLSDLDRDNNEPVEVYSGLAALTKGSNERLVDAWRLIHGDKREYTWQRTGSDANAPMARIDHVLISPAMRTELHDCQILRPTSPLTTDHSPVCVSFEMHGEMREKAHHSCAPELTIQQVNVQRLEDPKCSIEYTGKFDDNWRHQLVEQTDGYAYVTESILRFAKSTLGLQTRIINRKRKPESKTNMEKISSYIRTVHLSKYHVLEATERDRKFYKTKMIQKLVRTIPKTDIVLQDPGSISTRAEAEQWFEELRKVGSVVAKRVMDEFNKRTSNRIEAILENKHQQECSNPRAFFKSAMSHITGGANRKQMTMIEDEIPSPADEPKSTQDPKLIRQKTSRWYEYLFQSRGDAPRGDTPWFSAKFMNRRRHIIGAEKLCALISKDELECALRRLKRRKAYGGDMIAGELLKHLPDNGRAALLAVFNEILQTHKIPEEWKLAKIFTIHKGGDPSHCSNYRPISITSVVYKVFASILTKRLEEFTETNKLLSDVQGGFRKNRSTIDKINQLTAIFAARIRTNSENHTVFLDIKKAYDSVPHAELFVTLHKHGIPAEFVSLIQALYANGKACVMTAYGDSPTFNLERGVKQGCPMSPLIFNLFLEPLLEWLTDTAAPDSHILAFADDIAVNTLNSWALQEILNSAEKFFHYNRLEIGIAKSKTVYMTSNPEQNDIYYTQLRESRSGNTVQLVPEIVSTALPKLSGNATYRYLGVQINTKLDWSIHYAAAEARLRQHIQCLYRTGYTRKQLVKIVNVLIIPYLSYGFEVITPNATVLDGWDRMINNLINTRGGLLRSAKNELNFLPIEEIGEGLESISDRVTRLQYMGRLKHGLNSPDPLTELRVREEWNNETSKYSKKNFDKESKTKLGIEERKDIPKDSLDQILNPYTGHVCQQHNITKASQLLVDGNQLTHTLRATWYRQQLCVGESTLVLPHLVRRINPGVAVRGVVHPAVTQQSPVTIFCDGSKRGDYSGYSIYINHGNVLNHAQPQPLGRENFSAELRGLATAIALHDESRPLRIISDCEGALKVMEKPLRHLHEHPLDAEYLRLAHEVLQYRIAKGLDTELIHTYSHINITSPDPKMREKVTAMRVKFGAEFDRIIQGNEAADELAKKATYRLPGPIKDECPDLGDKFRAVDEQGCVVEAVSERLKKIQTEVHRNELQKESKYDWMKRKDVDWHRTALLGKNNARGVNVTQKFASKARRNLFADKVSRAERQGKTYWATRRYSNIRVGDDRCDSCRSLVEKEVLEDKRHYLYCEAHRELRAEITRKVIDTINTHAKTPVADVPCFWNEDEKHPQSGNETWKRVEQFTPLEASQALIPKAWVEYLKSIEWKSEADFEETVGACQILIVDGLRQCWRARCKTFFDLHKPEPATAPT